MALIHGNIFLSLNTLSSLTSVKSKEGDLPYDMAVNEKVKSLFEDLLLRTRAEVKKIHFRHLSYSPF